MIDDDMSQSTALELLSHLIRPARGAAPEGALVLFHGRGADENDLYPLLDAFDPDGRLVGATPRAPLQLPPGGFHWYVSAGIPTPDRDTFLETHERVGQWLDAFAAETGVPASKTILGGFSQGTVMTYAMAFGKGRPRPAGIMAFSGFMPQVEGFELELSKARELPVALGHGTADMVIPVEWGRHARQRLDAEGAKIMYAESPMGHSIDPRFAASLPGWVAEVLSTVGR